MGRSRQLALTDSGVEVYRGLIEAANERDAAFAALLSDEEAQVLGRALEKLADLALSLERRERERLKEG